VEFIRLRKNLLTKGLRMYKIVDVKINITKDDEEYFADPERFGSTEYAEYMKNKAIGLAISIESRASLERSETGALLFGKALHLCLHDPEMFKTFNVGKTQSTTPASFTNNELGIKDYFMLKHFLESFNVDLNAIRNSSEFFEQEIGYFLDITILDESTGEECEVKFRCKPDLAFRLSLDPTLYIVDWKTMSRYSGSEFSVKYMHQGELYSHLMYLVTGVGSIEHINYIFEKEHPYKQYDLESNIFQITESSQRLFLKNAIRMNSVRKDHKPFLSKNAVIGNSILKCFSRWD
jgi:hypothetical protein